MRRLSTILITVALVLGLAQCKKEQPTPQSEGVMITLNVGDNNNGSRANVNPTAAVGVDQVTFEKDDQILVASAGKYVGYLQHNGTNFSGSITNPTENEPLYFYFLGNKIDVSTLTAGTTTECTVNISDQSNYPHLPVISMGQSSENYDSETTSYSSRLYNKCSLMKFDVTTPSNAAICIEGMNNQVSVNFGTNAFTYGQVNGGLIKMKGGSGSPAVKWVIVLPNNESITTTAYTEDGNYIASGDPTTIDPIVANTYYDSGIDVYVNTINPTGPLATPLTFEAKTAGATVTLQSVGSAPSLSLVCSTDGGDSWTTYTVGDPKTLTNIGDKIMFRGTNTTLATSTSNYHMFVLNDNGEVYVYGNVMSLLDASGYATANTLSASYTFRSLFEGCSGLYNDVDGKPIVLPATTIKTFCYQRMFFGCTHLTVAPELPASETPTSCYHNMFNGCISLTSAPEKLGTTLGMGCYNNMFNGCTGLTTAPMLPAETLAIACYSNMFNGCTSLTTAPMLPAETLAQQCYQQMFCDCTTLTSITCLAKNNINTMNTRQWVSNVASSGIFTKASGVTWPNGDDGIPNGWTPVDYN